MQNFKVGLCQINSQNDIKTNLSSIEEMVKKCAEGGADMAVFPEYSSYLSDFNVIAQGESFDGPIISRFRELARRNRIFIHNGSFIEKIEGEEKVYNTSVLFNRNGEIVSFYRKIHLFDVYLPGIVDVRESATIKAGDKVVTADTDFCCLGFSICYDLRFPELYRKIVEKNVKLIFVPAAFTLYTGKDHWEPLLRARAIENQVYIIAVCQFGPYDQGHYSYGNSMVIDPWGTVISRAREEVCCTLVEIDLSFTDKVRGKIPSLKNRVNFLCEEKK